MFIKRILMITLTLTLTLSVSLFICGCGNSQEEAADTANTANTANTFASMSGDYQDEVSQRATATVIAQGDSESVQIEVMWSESAKATKEWEMTATVDSQKLVYDDCLCKEIEYDENGNTVNEVIKYKDGSGYFRFNDKGKLLWTGAADEDCGDCSFVKIQ